MDSSGILARLGFAGNVTDFQNIYEGKQNTDKAHFNSEIAVRSN